MKKRLIYIGLAALAALILGWLIFRKRGVEQAPLPADNPLSPGAGQLTQEEARQVREISISLYQVLKGWALDIFFRDPEPYQDFMGLSDRLFVAVYNDFNTNYSDGKDTLRNWINNDLYYGGSRAYHAIEMIITRMNRLNLK